MTPEGKVKKECRAYLKSIGAYVFSPVQQGFGQSTVDDLVCFRGTFLGIEYKRADKPSRTTARQDATIAAINNAGGYAFLARSAEEVRLTLIEFKLLQPHP